MHTLIQVALSLSLSFGLLAAESPPPLSNETPSTAAVDLLVREVRYHGTLTDAQAKFAVDIDAESLGKGETEVALFEGEVALLPAKLPPALRIMRNNNQYRLVASKPGRYRFKLELIAKITRAEPWNQISFIGPVAGISSITAAPEAATVEVQLLSGTPLEPDKDNPGLVRAVLGPDRTLALRWQSKTAEAARKTLTTCDTAANVRVTPTVIKFATLFHYEIVQGNLATLAVLLPASHTLTRIEGEQIRDWHATTEGDHQTLTVELIKPVEKSYALTVYSEQTVENTPFQAQLNIPQPQGVDRESGSLTIAAEDTLVETESTSGLRQVNPPDGAFAAYRFYGRPLALGLKLNRIEPVIHVVSRVTARLEEARLLVAHAFSLNVEKAGVYSIQLSPLDNCVVTDVRGVGVEDWKVRDGRLIVNFTSRLRGQHQIEVQTERAQKSFPERVFVTPLHVIHADRETAQIGVAPAAGIRVKTSELIGLREIPAASLTNRGDELLAFVADQTDWSLKLATERLAPRIITDVFNLVTIGDGLVGGSATARYVIVNQGVQEFKVRVPPQWKNVEFTGPNIRRKDQEGDVWTITLQDKAWGGYTLVVTYDEQFDPRQATLSLGGLHALDVERETGSVAITSAASLQLRENKAGETLQRIDESELAETDRALITRSVLLAYRYGAGDPYQLVIEVARFDELPVLEAVADRTQLTTALTEAGEMLTQALFMVKNNDKQFQRFTLPRGARFWSAYVNGQPARAETDGQGLLVPLPRVANRDQAFAVEIVYAQNVGSLKSVWPRDLALSAPVTDVQTTFAEWEVFVPSAYHLGRFGGNMSVARGTTYNLSDAWGEFVDAYRSLWRNTQGLLLGLAVALTIVGLVVAAVRRGWHGALAALATVSIVAVLGGMLLPSLAKSKAKAQRISAIDNLKQIGLAARIYAGDHGGKLPVSLEQMRDELSTDKVTIDPETGRRFVYLGAGRTEIDARSVLAYSPAKQGGRAVLFADGSVLQLDEPRFNEAMQIAAAGVGGGAGNPAGTSVTPPQKPPMVQGIRPIRIDVPRTGQRFVFTKVLNVGRTPLTFEAWAMTATMFNAVRSALQISAFVFGLLIVGWQLRRTAPRGFLVTLGLALILGSVVCLLMISRLLGMVLIVVAPLVAFGLLVALARKYWSRRGGAESAADAALNTLTPPPPGGAPGMGPAVATLALLIFASAANARENSPPPIIANRQSTIETGSIQSASYTGTVRDRVAEIDAVLQLATGRPGQIVPLFGNDVAVEEFTANPGDAKLIRQGDSVSVRLARKGNALLKVKFLVKLEGDVTKRRLAFAIPAALSSQLVLTLNEPEAAVEFPTAIAYHSVAAQQETRVEAVMGAGGRVEMQWTHRIKRAAEIAATVFARNASLATFTGGAMHVRSLLDYQITQGELRAIRVTVPAGHRLLRVEGESIRTWQVKEEAAKQILSVELLKGVSPDYRLRVETEATIDRLPANVAVEIPHALDVKRETGFVALNGGDELGLNVEEATGLQKVDADEFIKATGQTNTLAGAYQYLKPGFVFAVRVEPLQPQVEAVVRNRVQIGAEQIHLQARVNYTIKRAGVFALRLLLPDEFRVETVSGPDIAQWVEKSDGDRRVLEVLLKQRTLGDYALELQLVKSQKELPKTMEIIGVHPLDTAKLSGFVIVSPDAGVQAKTASLEGLTEVPVTSVPEGGSGLAYKFIGADPAPSVSSWKLQVATEAIESWVRAEAVNWLTLSESLVTGRAVVRYEIQNAPVKEFRLKIPAAFRNVEIIGADIRRRDQNGDEWRIELQNKVSGNFLLTVTWEQPWSIREQAGESLFQAAGIEAVGVERATGILAVTAKPPLQIAPKQASSELIRIDTQETPEWAGVAREGTALAYRYLRPGYQLSLAVQRFTQAEVLQALVEDLRMTTVVADDGQMMTEVALSIRNNGRQFLEIALPKGAQVWSAFVAGQAVKPSLRGDRLLLPLERGSDAAIAVELIYVGAGPFPKTKGRVNLASPTLDVPVKTARWELYLPPDYAYGRFGGTITRELEAEPVYASYSLSEYSLAEDKTRKAREVEASSSVNEVRSKLSLGKLEEASKAYNNARRYRAGEEREDFKELEKDLRKAQSGNLLNAQQAVIANNAYFLQQSADQPARPLDLKFDDQTAGEQWVRLQRAQEVSTTSVRPLRVNLPSRGLRHSFSQVLQTEVGKPMVVSFVASNARTPSWVMRIALMVVGFAGLWTAVNLMLAQRISRNAAREAVA